MIEWLGMGPLLLGGIGLASFAAATFLYLFRFASQRVTVAFLPLWLAPLAQARDANLSTKLRRLLSLILQLIAIFLILLALAQPKLSDKMARHVILVIDQGASMSAVAEGEKSRFEQSLEDVRLALAQFGSQDWIGIIGASKEATIVQALTQDRKLLLEKLSELKAEQSVSSLSRANDMARTALSDRNRPEIFFFTDKPKEVPKENAVGGLPRSTTISEGSLAQNAGIRRFSASRSPSDPLLIFAIAELENHADKAQRAELYLESVDSAGNVQSVVEYTKLNLEPHSHKNLKWSSLPSSFARLRLRVSFDAAMADATAEPVDAAPPGNAKLEKELIVSFNAIAWDDVAEAAIPALKPLHIALVGKENHFLEAALLLDPRVKLTTLYDDVAGLNRSSDAFDIVIANGILPALSKQPLALLLFGASDQAGVPCKKTSTVEGYGFDDYPRESDLWRGLALDDVQILKGDILRPESDDEVLGLAWNKPIAVRGVRAGKRFIQLGFEPSATDFVLRASWPLFIERSLAWLSEEGAVLSAMKAQVGEAFRPLESWGKLLEVDGEKAEFFQPEDRRAHLLRFEKVKQIQALSSAFSPDLSLDTRLDKEALRTPVEPNIFGESSFFLSLIGRLRLVQWALLAACIVALFEALAYHRRWF